MQSALEAATDDHPPGHHTAIERAATPNGDISAGIDAALRHPVDMQPGLQGQFADQAGSLRDNRDSDWARLLRTAFAKESHGTRSSSSKTF